MLYDYDVAYLGSGHSCWHGALTLAAAGKKGCPDGSRSAGRYLHKLWM